MDSLYERTHFLELIPLGLWLVSSRFAQTVVNHPLLLLPSHDSHGLDKGVLFTWPGPRSIDTLVCRETSALVPGGPAYRSAVAWLRLLPCGLTTCLADV